MISSLSPEPWNLYEGSIGNFRGKLKAAPDDLYAMVDSMVRYLDSAAWFPPASIRHTFGQHRYGASFLLAASVGDLPQHRRRLVLKHVIFASVPVDIDLRAEADEIQLCRLYGVVRVSRSAQARWRDHFSLPC